MGWDKRAQEALDTHRAMFKALLDVTSMAEFENKLSSKPLLAVRMMHLELMCTLPTNPEHWFQHAIELLGEDQLSTACLHPQLWQQQQAEGFAAQLQHSRAVPDIMAAVQQLLSAAQVPVAAAVRDGLKARSSDIDILRQQASSKHWLHRMKTAYEEWQLAQQELLSGSAPCSPHCGCMDRCSSSSSRQGTAGQSAAAAAGTDQLQSLASEPDAFRELLGSVAPLVTWQSEWTTAAAVLGNCAIKGRNAAWIDLLTLKLVFSHMSHHRRSADSTEDAGSGQQQREKKKAGSAAGRKQKRQGKPVGQAAAAAAQCKQPDSPEDAQQQRQQQEAGN